MGTNPFFSKHTLRAKDKPKNPFGQEVSKMTKATGKRIGGALRAEFARMQKRKDSRSK